MAIKPEIKSAVAKVAGAGAAGSIVGSGIGGALGNAIEPLKTVMTQDKSWHINNNDGTTSYTNISHVLNQGLHDAVAHATGVTGAVILGTVAAGLAARHVYKNRNLGRQFD
jgi:hypothetical protein